MWKGGVHISKLAYEDLTLGVPWSIPCGQCLDPTLGKFSPLYGTHLGPQSAKTLILHTTIMTLCNSA